MTQAPKTERLIATVRQNFGGRWYSSGEAFLASPAEAADLIALRYARRDEHAMGRRARGYLRRDMQAEQQQPGASAALPPSRPAASEPSPSPEPQHPTTPHDSKPPELDAP
jgi:hypothetical protein